MSARIRNAIRNQWMGALALFLVLTGGTAWAAGTIASEDIINNQVKSADVRDDTLAGGGLQAVDLAKESVTRQEVSTLFKLASGDRFWVTVGHASGATLTSVRANLSGHFVSRP